ncbi:hypothetical protein [Sphingobacterium paucimobilis]|uniref:Uncharacterized protein n=1 Tax=Sphingobacterium paucimobilis HER1398 TaxID=1346330 RepID=U2HDA9_9SPHI|nr:hypothetical protein [Sphingobacterium paucimobilis]ERJ59731.1 hypothetical protein M472_13215 [Sphingobacterium paucimobilis HER1398]
MLRLLRITCLLLFSINYLNLNAQEIGLRVNFFGYADNREYGARYTQDKTIFGTLIAPQIYFKLSENHTLFGGGYYNQDFGSHPEDKRQFNPIAYYNYTSTNINFAIGFMPRYERLKDIPRIVLADTFMYDRPNLEGMYFQYKKGNFDQRIFIDWLSKQSDKYREQFVAGISGKYQTGLFYVSHAGILYHNAVTSNENLKEHVQDNAVITAAIGIDLSRKTIFDSLKMDIGAAVGFDRVRTEYDMRITKGFIASQYIGYKKVALNNTLYLGQAQYLPNGDPFYRRNRYDRLDFSWSPFKTRAIEAKLVVSFHFSSGKVDNQQAFVLRYNFGQSLWRKQK